MKIVAIIHARGGSKRIPLKNIQMLGGKPLLAYPIELVKGDSKIDRVIVTTDNPKIEGTALTYGAEVPFKRPADISEDVPSELVTEHALKYLVEEEKYRPDIAVTLTPATPFTRLEDLREGIQLLLEHPEWDSVVTVRKANEFPQWMIDYEPGKPCKTLMGNPLNGEYNVSQNLKRYYYPVGAFFVNRVEAFLKKPCLYGENWGAIELDAERHIDIDEPEELERAKKMIDLLKEG
ncbi:cytidylyltransferase domain-containing protein [Thermodesulfobacteriota bacterium]